MDLNNFTNKTRILKWKCFSKMIVSVWIWMTFDLRVFQIMISEMDLNEIWFVCLSDNDFRDVFFVWIRIKFDLRVFQIMISEMFFSVWIWMKFDSRVFQIMILDWIAVEDGLMILKLLKRHLKLFVQEWWPQLLLLANLECQRLHCIHDGQNSRKGLTEIIIFGSLLQNKVTGFYWWIFLCLLL
jgi:hypothetical protein